MNYPSRSILLPFAISMHVYGFKLLIFIDLSRSNDITIGSTWKKVPISQFSERRDLWHARGADETYIY